MYKRINMYKTKKRMETLAKTVVDDMDLDDLCGLAIEHHIEYYEKMSSEEFEEAWKERFE